MSLISRDDDTEFYAAVCQEGHIVNTRVVSVELRRALHWTLPEERPRYRLLPNFCGRCGLPVFVACERCGTPFAVSQLSSGPAGLEAEPFCQNCGVAHPWATRDQMIRRLKAQIDFDKLPRRDQLALSKAIDQLAIPEPQRA